jgi:hypothetical protein
MLLQTVKCDGFEADWLNNSTAAGRPLALEAQSMGSQRCDRVQFQGLQCYDKMLFVMCFFVVVIEWTGTTMSKVGRT